MSKRIAKDLAVNGTTLVPQSAWNDELERKHQKVVEWLKSQKLGGVLIRRNENVAWITGGAVELRVLTPAETGVAAILVTAEGKRYYFTTENEAPRLHDEEFGALDFEPVLFPWYADDTLESAKKLAGGPLASDTPQPGTTSANLFPLRQSLSETEIARYKWLGAQTAAATAESLDAVEPGMSEYDLEAMTAANLLKRGILPSVYLYAVDDRIFKYKHAVARGARLKQYGMLNLCTRKFGLAISITRFVHFGKLPAELASRFQSAANVNAALLDASRVGATSAQLFKVAQDAYTAEGYPGEERFHHQGGPTGYGEREWVATPNGTETVVNNQAFAWNPSIRGGKAEDTVLLRDGKIEWLTATPELPVINATVNGNAYPAAGALIK
ncbi:M24 family metallopeptidase [Occallatibacter riparius]|uniref:M24 family metallopeptidase n=1 Tax=Occallatibacter riparius TaxID=1002689 RepID=A0A9J7BKA4_9BACT|nr:M24 family metallopeptidase [Occallatibacter riparius]UWZ81709.1 M24 family metallopeptidase [Occallatibacter riparius]